MYTSWVGLEYGLNHITTQVVADSIAPIIYSLNISLQSDMYIHHIALITVPINKA